MMIFPPDYEGVGKISSFLSLSVNISKTVADTAKVTMTNRKPHKKLKSDNRSFALQRDCDGCALNCVYCADQFRNELCNCFVHILRIYTTLGRPIYIGPLGCMWAYKHVLISRRCPPNSPPSVADIKHHKRSLSVLSDMLYSTHSLRVSKPITQLSCFYDRWLYR